MSAWLDVIEPGIAVTIQDLGRLGHRSIGVPLAGAADAVLLACANALLGQNAGLAALEIGLVGPTLRAGPSPLQLGLAGHFAPVLQREGEAPLATGSWRSITLQPGEQLSIGPCRQGVGYVAVTGGCDVPLVLGSRATYARAALGGIEGRAPRAGDRIACSASVGPERQAARPFEHATGPLRALPGPQDDHFDAETLACFFASAWRVTRDADRMGQRLEGPILTHRPDKGADIVSEAVTPGAVQVPGSGQPIVLGVDAQTIGGYAKIATVIGADLPRLAHLRPGSKLHFEAVSRDQALAARQAQAAALREWIAAIGPWRPTGETDLQALLGANLISGMIDAGPNAPNPLSSD